MVTLRNVDESNWWATLALTVNPDQQRFISDYAPIAAVVLAKAYIRPAGMTWLPYAIYADAVLVGLLALVLNVDNSDDCWVFHFFIDQRFQNRGYGKAALIELINVVKHMQPRYAGISLVVHPENHVAQYLYASVGFRPTGAKRWDQPEYRLQLEGTHLGLPSDVNLN